MQNEAANKASHSISKVVIDFLNLLVLHDVVISQRIHQTGVAIACELILVITRIYRVVIRAIRLILDIKPVGWNLLTLYSNSVHLFYIFSFLGQN